MQSLPELDLQGIPCEVISWESFYRMSQRLARTIHTSWFRPDLIIAIGRGGYLPARILSDYLDVLDLASIKIEHYHAMHREENARIRYPLAARVEGRRILLVDDVSDSGDTFDVAIRHIRQHGEPLELRTAVLHHKIVSQFVPDYYAKEVKTWRWIIYPWAIIEDLGSFLRDMDPAPESVDEFAARLVEQHGIVVERSLLEHVMAFVAG